MSFNDLIAKPIASKSPSKGGFSSVVANLSPQELAAKPKGTPYKAPPTLMEKAKTGFASVVSNIKSLPQTIATNLLTANKPAPVKPLIEPTFFQGQSLSSAPAPVPQKKSLLDKALSTAGETADIVTDLPASSALKLGTENIKTAATDIYGTLTDEGQRASDWYESVKKATTGKGTKADVAGKTVSLVSGLVNIPLSILGAPFKAAETVPAIGETVAEINKAFGTVGEVGSKAAQVIVDQIPFVSQETKNSLMGPIGEVGGILAMLAAGKATHEIVKPDVVRLQDTIQKTIEADPQYQAKKAEVVKPIEPSVPTPVEPMIDARVSKTASDVNQKIAEKSIDVVPEELLAKYKPTTKAEQAQNIADLLSNDLEGAKSMIRGEKEIPSNILPPVLFNALEEHALKTNDIGLLNDLAKSPVASMVSEAAQSLGAHGYSINEQSPVQTIRNIIKVREESVKGMFKSFEKPKERVIKEIKSSIPRPKKQTWNDFIREIQC